MRILILNWRDVRHPAAGGAELYVHRVAMEWARTGHAVTHFSANVSGEPNVTVADGIQVMRSGSKLGVYRAARSYVEQHGRFDLIIDCVNTRPFLTPSYAAGAPVAALIFQLAAEVWHYEMPLPLAAVGRWWLEPRWLRSYRNVPVLTISDSSRQSLEQRGLRRVVVVPVGLEKPQTVEPRVPPKCPTAVFVARLVKNKRPEHAIAAFDEARKAIPAARLIVIGAGPLETTLRRRWESDNVSFLGRVDDATKFALMRNSDALLATSVREGWGMTVSEAACVGTHSIAYDVPGLRDSVAAAGGVLVTPTPQALAEAIARHLPEWHRMRPPIATSGTTSWSDVAAAVFEAAVQRCQLQ